MSFHLFKGFEVMGFLDKGAESGVESLSRVRLFATPWTVAYQAPLSVGFSRGSSQPRDQTRVSHIVDRCFTIWATSLKVE